VSSASIRAKVAGSTKEARVSDQDWASGEESIDDSGRNPTQQRMDEEGVEDELVTVEPEEQEDEPWAT
jgi:hypothetical protein